MKLFNLFGSENNLPGWDDHFGNNSPPDGQTTDSHNLFTALTRANSRYRLARSLNSLSVDGYSDNQSTGSISLELVRNEFSWSSVEIYCGVLNHCGEDVLNRRTKKPSSRNLGILFSPALKQSDLRSRLDKLRALGGNRTFRTFIQKAVVKALADLVEEFFKGSDERVLCLSAAMRHAFSHGKIAPLGKWFPPDQSTEKKTLFCSQLAGTVLDCIAFDFKNRAPSLKSKLGDLLEPQFEDAEIF